MKPFFTYIICLVTLFTTVVAGASDDSILPKLDQVKTEAPSLTSAIAQFNNILDTSPEGDMAQLQANSEYNEHRIRELETQLAEKTSYLEKLSDIVSRQFDELMDRYADADQEQRNRIADDLQARWHQIEKSTRQEIAELQEQLAVAASRASESHMKRQMLQISTSLAKTKLVEKMPDVPDDLPPGASPAYTRLQELSRQRIIATVLRLCPLNVKPLDTDFSIRHFEDSQKDKP